MQYTLTFLFSIISHIHDPLLLNNHLNISVIFIFLSLIVSIIMVVIPYFLTGRTLKMNEVVSEYECGFEPFDSATRQPFNIEYYIIGVLFIIFDAELTLCIP